jgi:4-amino-4-deoxy-L-arabinose transferase-like glycosyltransferase
MPQWLRHQLLILALATPVLFFRLGDARLWDRDEPRNAQCVVEMLARGDWVVPYFNGELRTHKPVLLYWLIMSAYGIFGVNEFAARFWSAALGLGTVLCTYHLGKRLFNSAAGLWAALALAPALMFDVASRAATPDATLIFCTTATLSAFVCFAFPSAKRAPCEPRFSSSVWAGVAVYGLMSLAVLAKGPVGIVIPLAIMIGSLWTLRCLSGETNVEARAIQPGAQREWLWNLRVRLVEPWKQFAKVLCELQPLTALAMVLLIATPWYAWVGWRTGGGFLFGFFWDHNVRRATESMEGHSGPAILFYPATLLLGFFPASVFLIAALLQAWRQLSWPKQLLSQSGQAASIVFCLAWIIVVVGLFSLAETKLPSYVTPCYPALALLVGNVLQRWTSGSLAISERWLRWSVAATIPAGLAIILGILLVAQRFLPGEESLAWIGLVLVAGGCAALICDLWLRSPTRAAAIHVGSALLFSLLLFGLGPAAADRHQQSHLLVRMLRDAEPEEIAAWRCLEPSWVFYLGRPIRELEEWRDAVEFLSHEDRTLIMRAEDYANVADRLPGDVQVLGESPRFLRDGCLLTLRRDSERLSRSPGESERR